MPIGRSRWVLMGIGLRPLPVLRLAGETGIRCRRFVGLRLRLYPTYGHRFVCLRFRGREREIRDEGVLLQGGSGQGRPRPPFTGAHGARYSGLVFGRQEASPLAEWSWRAVAIRDGGASLLQHHARGRCGFIRNSIKKKGGTLCRLGLSAPPPSVAVIRFLSFLLLLVAETAANRCPLGYHRGHRLLRTATHGCALRQAAAIVLAQHGSVVRRPRQHGALQVGTVA